MRRVDAIVVGGGLAGMAAAVAVGRSGIEALHIAPKAPPDRRTSALMGPSVAWMQEAELIGEPGEIGHPLKAIRIIDATARAIRAPEVLFRAEEAGLPAFGWNFPNVALAARFETARQALGNVGVIEKSAKKLARADGKWELTLASGEVLAAPLIVGADGKTSLVRSAAGFRTREEKHAQAALVADLELTRPLEGTSVEFHYENGPFTLVPANGTRANLVWIDAPDRLAAAQASGPQALEETFAGLSRRLFGPIRLLTGTHVFPLSNLTVNRAGLNGVLLAGESAHAFPPIGAQGLNLGLRDVADLSQVLGEADRSSPDWAVRASEDYAQRRAGDLARTGALVDGLFRSLVGGLLPTHAMRAGGLWAMKLSPALRRRAFAVGMGNR